jgi:hypothetical protein
MSRDVQADALRLIKFAGFTKQAPKSFNMGARFLGVTVSEFEEIWDEVRPIYEAALGWRFEEDEDYIRLVSRSPSGDPQLLREQQAVIEYIRERKAA